MKTAFLYSDELVKFDYGPDHPLKIFRLKLTYELIKACGLLSPGDSGVVEPRPAEEEDLFLFHEPDYIEMLKAVNSGRSMPGADYFGLGPGENPVFRGVFEWSRLVAGASVIAAEMVAAREVDRAFSMAGGLHHAMPSMASGFCYVNDPAIAISRLLKKGRRVAYIDIDAHHADGVQEAFYATDRVLTISLHETGRTLFPGTGFEYETGEGQGRGYSLNVPLPPDSDDDLFLFAFDEIVPAAIERFRPDIVVSQLGVDSFRSDPLTHLGFTNNGFCGAVKRIRDLSPGLVALGGGGYDIANVAKAWTLAWAIMNDAEVPDEIPEDFLRKYSAYGFGSGRMRDDISPCRRPDRAGMRKEVERVVQYLLQNALPLVTAG